jgi:hypothetical protein
VRLLCDGYLPEALREQLGRCRWILRDQGLQCAGMRTSRINYVEKSQYRFRAQWLLLALQARADNASVPVRKHVVWVLKIFNEIRI